MAKDWSKYILPVGVIALSYYVLRNLGIIGPVCDPTCSQCPRGESYSQPFGSCDANYTPCGLLHESCCCDCCLSLEDNLGLEEMGWEPIPEYQLVYLRDLVDSL